MILINRTRTVVTKNDKPTREIGLSTIFTLITNGLFLVFFVTSASINFNKSKIVVGLLYLVLAGLAVVPHKLLRVTQALKILILVILFCILATVAARGDPIPEQKYENFNLGQKFTLNSGKNSFSMVVREAKNNAKISVAGKEVTTSGSFFIVTGDVTNLGSEAVDFKFAKDPQLKDSQNRQYTLYGAGIPVGKLQPSVAKEVSYVFEIPKDAAGLTFIVQDQTEIIKSVSLGK